MKSYTKSNAVPDGEVILSDAKGLHPPTLKRLIQTIRVNPEELQTIKVDPSLDHEPEITLLETSRDAEAAAAVHAKWAFHFGHDGRGEYSFRQVADSGQFTIYTRAVFGINQQQVKQILIIEDPFTQYGDTLYVRSLEPRARKVYAQRISAGPFLVLKGWNHPKLDSELQNLPTRIPGIKASRTRHSSFSKEYQIEFVRRFRPYVESLPEDQIYFNGLEYNSR